MNISKSTSNILITRSVNSRSWLPGTISKPDDNTIKSTCFPTRPFAVNSSIHHVKKFEWQHIFCLNTLIFISQSHMQKFFTYFPSVFFNLAWKLASKMRMNTIRQLESTNHKIELLGDFPFNEVLKTVLD